MAERANGTYNELALSISTIESNVGAASLSHVSERMMESSGDGKCQLEQERGRIKQTEGCAGRKRG
jgi:hypothetical protein